MLHNKQYGGKKNSQYLKFSRGLISRAVCNRLIVKVIFDQKKNSKGYQFKT